jgi:hypothetical protein
MNQSVDRRAGVMGSWKICSHLENGRLELTRTLPRSYLSDHFPDQAKSGSDGTMVPSYWYELTCRSPYSTLTGTGFAGDIA